MSVHTNPYPNLMSALAAARALAKIYQIEFVVTDHDDGFRVMSRRAYTRLTPPLPSVVGKVKKSWQDKPSDWMPNPGKGT